MIKIENLEKMFHTDEIETYALNGVNFEVKKSEFVAVMGPSGCGKFTRLNIIGLLDNPTKVSYLLNGTEVAAPREKDPTKLREGHMGFVFQSSNQRDQV